MGPVGAAAYGEAVLTPYDALVCPKHGWMGHVFTHEAAHAVAAVDRGIPFERVTISTPDQWVTGHAEHPDGTVLGGVHLTPPPSTWVMPDPAAALEFVMAGALAEGGAYGHYVRGSFDGDLRIWRQGVGLLEAQTTESFEAAAGVTVEDARRGTKTWLVDAYPRIKEVAAALAGAQPGQTRSVVTFHSGPWSLTYEEVRELAAR